MFETHYFNTTPVPCPQIIDVNAGYINWQYYQNGSLVTAPTAYTTASLPSSGMCTTDTGTTGDYYVVYPEPKTVSDTTWTVISNPSP
jgi:hypothetical protein